MPTKTLPEQTGNSCAAHCTVIAIAELLGVGNLMSKAHAERVVWPAIKFKPNGDPVVELLAKAENSDPRRIVSEVLRTWGGLKVTLLCDETQKKDAIKNYVPKAMKLGLKALFNMLKGSGSVANVTLEDGVYYNSSFLMFTDATANPVSFAGMHNILVTKQGGQVYYYNSNESVPKWSVVSDWKKLENQNGGQCSY